MSEILSAEQIAVLKSLPVMRLRMNSVCASHEALRDENERLRERIECLEVDATLKE